MAERVVADGGGTGAPSLAPVEVEVAGVEALGPYRLLRLSAPPAFQIGAPGRFHMVRDPDASGLLPWAVAVLPHPAGGPAVLVGAAGPTGMLARASRLVVLGPLGRGFEVEDLNREATLAVAQGHGIASVAGLGAALRAPARLLVAADDGDDGDDGEVAATLAGDGAEVLDVALVAGRLEALIATGGLRQVLVAASGSLRAEVVARCLAAGVPCQVALEAPMACGFGACHGCVVRLDGVWRRLCLEGPVVDARRLATP